MVRCEPTQAIDPPDVGTRIHRLVRIQSIHMQMTFVDAATLESHCHKKARRLIQLSDTVSISAKGLRLGFRGSYH